MEITKRELVLIISIVVLFSLLLSKSLIFDEVGVQTGQKEVFRNDMNELINQQYSNTIIKHKLVKIKVEKKENETAYTGKIRKYLFGILPFSEVSVVINYDNEEILK